MIWLRVRHDAIVVEGCLKKATAYRESRWEKFLNASRGAPVD